ncbi:acyl-CoA dehydrogenase [Streptomyces sp. TRM68416]|uniref:acyl-CoA dehydrogenase family protein n=1 Tax=Streptomyces sp. TRM68416 TaxID=2758412 RepID=UPI001661A485|nr:acyl-CoA dehydrogenase [Streptomyces sp. TRM68416]MBD0840990.1 acyl-CoA oxidase [Streptomyces sp. TRM68416]
MLLASLPVATRDEMHRLLHGTCDPSFLSALHKALADDHGPHAAKAGDGGGQLLHRLRLLGETLPAADRLLDDPARLAAVHAWAAVADPSLCLAALVHHLLCLGSVVQLADGRGEHLGPRMEALRKGRAKGVYLITEAGQANSHLATRTRADHDPATGEFVLHTPDPQAAKFGSAGTLDVPQTAVVLARVFTDGTDRGVFAFVVDLTGDDGLLPGVEVSSPLGLGALPLDYVLVRFHRVRVPYAGWLADGAGIAGDGTFHDPAGSGERRLQRTLRVGQGLWAIMPAVAAATTRQAAVQAVNYARQRRTQGRLAPGVPLLAYRTQQRAVLGALADAFALTCAAGGARTVWTESLSVPAAPAGGRAGEMGFTPWAAVSRPLAAYKAAAVRLAAEVTADCRRRCGFSGYLDVNRLTAYHGFHHAFDAAGGDSQLIFYDIGRSLTEEGGPAPGDTPSPPPAASPHWWPAIVRRHRERLTRHLSEQLRATDPSAPFDAWNPLLEDVGLLGEVYANALMADDVIRTLDGIRDHDLAQALRPLAALHGVMAARRWSGSLLAHGTLHPADVRRLPEVADELCDAVAPHLPLLVEAFAHPADIATAPLAAADHDTALRATLTWTRGGTE